MQGFARAAEDTVNSIPWNPHNASTRYPVPLAIDLDTSSARKDVIDLGLSVLVKSEITLRRASCEPSTHGVGQGIGT